MKKKFIIKSLVYTSKGLSYACVEEQFNSFDKAITRFNSLEKCYFKELKKFNLQFWLVSTTGKLQGFKGVCKQRNGQVYRTELQ